ncbi:hypothetical protein QA645_21920 [Bradyrhizobium sp. CIAT3101]|uniref:hypothetical protein n=1 Tax=Bradyrhizobium sp. CIAT3101 TaxID=439387 RepID=UPI0024B23B15|nr:hypothetical protein [Bradyrhizobium sp. CIAT3101]WFU85295.1 hypothetical protein QA645_21920 [Bradyrhizobium sp. CIAT3101]
MAFSKNPRISQPFVVCLNRTVEIDRLSRVSYKTAAAACPAFSSERDLSGARQFGALASVGTGDATQGVAGREARLDSPPFPGLVWLRRQNKTRRPFGAPREILFVAMMVVVASAQ